MQRQSVPRFDYRRDFRGSQARRDDIHTGSNMFLKVCPICGKEFYAREESTKMCSPECRAEMNRRRTAEHNKLRRAPKPRIPNAEILEIAKKGINYGQMVAEKEYPVKVDKVFEDNMDELRFEK